MQLRLNNLRVSLLNDAPLNELAAKKLGIRKQNIGYVWVKIGASEGILGVKNYLFWYMIVIDRLISLRRKN